ncbi:hypothetical protein DAPPUDRAFT_105705 [Daphnia pulex]|uniref:Uncharacterized protein n=1 Tax=Daphnia pulex TaxID=6669 RepID=E9GRJ4_DAPPU|nr:hypothetical protein DAPPUDRAFT_105705 [Daphnia pulex]|eukprot:EFX77905.1 hypothetical protein DAPPUDRAFT_105705 [Daphnia pulex]
MSQKTHNLFFPFPLMGKWCYNRQLQKPPLDGAALLSFMFPSLSADEVSCLLHSRVPAKTRKLDPFRLKIRPAIKLTQESLILFAGVVGDYLIDFDGSTVGCRGRSFARHNFDKCPRSWLIVGPSSLMKLVFSRANEKTKGWERKKGEL